MEIENLINMSLTELPGMIDVHVHLRDPGATNKEDFYSGTCAALAGGVTLLLDMPNNPQPVISQKDFKNKLKIAKKKAVCDFGLIFGASQSDNTSEFSKVFSYVAALKVYMDQTTGSLLINRLSLLEKIFQKWPEGKPIMVHAEEGTMAKALALALIYKKHLHFCHVSLAEEVKLIKIAKQQGADVSAEVTPHHLFLTEKDKKKLGPYGIMKPPLRSIKDQDSLWQGIKEGVIDMVATDHAPHTREEKEKSQPPFGVPGLEICLPLLLTAVKKGKLTLGEVIKLYYENPQKIFNLAKQKDTYIKVDLNAKWVIKNENLFTKCRWSPFNDWQVYGKVAEVVLRGKNVYQEGKIMVKPGYGRLINNN